MTVGKRASDWPRNAAATFAIVLTVTAQTGFAGQEAGGGATAAAPEYLNGPDLEGLPFSEAVRHGDTLYLAGQVGTVPGKGNTLIEGGIAAEARQVMENIKAALERHGSSIDRVIKCQVFLADIGEWQDFNAVYVTFFKPDRLPARSAFGANGLALGARVEVECIAAAGS